MWKSLFNAILGTGALYLLESVFEFHPIAFIFFVLISFYLYFSLGAERNFFAASFWILTFLGVISSYFFSVFGPVLSPFFHAGILFVYGLFFFFLFLFVFLPLRRTSTHLEIFHTFILVLDIIVLSWFYRYLPFLFSSFLLFTVFFLLCEHFFSFFGYQWRRRIWLFSCVTAFLTIQFTWILSFLPFSFFYLALTLLLFVILVRDTLVVHLDGFLLPSFAFRQGVFFAFFVLVLLLFSQWGIS